MKRRWGREIFLTAQNINKRQLATLPALGYIKYIIYFTSFCLVAYILPIISVDVKCGMGPVWKNGLFEMALNFQGRCVSSETSEHCLVLWDEWRWTLQWLQCTGGAVLDQRHQEVSSVYCNVCTARRLSRARSDAWLLLVCITTHTLFISFELYWTLYILLIYLNLVDWG